MREFLEDTETGARSEKPMRDSQGAQAQLPKRFYNAVSVEPGDTGFVIALDGKTVRTPARRALELPVEAAAQIVADEWQAQGERIDPSTMPATRLANTALDGVATDPQAVLEDILKFAASDLLVYRAESPAGLVERQNALWDPVIDWLRDDLGANFILAEGIIHTAQPREALAAFGARMKRHADPLKLACLHTFTTLTGSAFLALAVAEGHLDAASAWAAAHVDEDWNIAQWGEDEAASFRRAERWREMDAAARLFSALG